MPAKDKLDLRARIAVNAQNDYKKIRKLLMSIVEGKLMEKVECKRKCGNEWERWVEEIPPCHKDRISASKLLKELQVDKSVANKKDTTADTTPTDLVAAVAEYHKLKEIEIQDKLEKAGKLRRIDS